eukprot:15366787-Ditylum_brightwellii.AAC.1
MATCRRTGTCCSGKFCTNLKLTCTGASCVHQRNQPSPVKRRSAKLVEAQTTYARHHTSAP